MTPDDCEGEPVGERDAGFDRWVELWTLPVMPGGEGLPDGQIGSYLVDMLTTQGVDLVVEGGP